MIFSIKNATNKLKIVYNMMKMVLFYATMMIIILYQMENVIKKWKIVNSTIIKANVNYAKITGILIQLTLNLIVLVTALKVT